MTAETPGGEALVEAARLELGRIYGQLQHEFVQPAIRHLDTEIAYWHSQHQSPASIAFRIGVKKSVVIDTLQRLGAA